MSGKEGCFPERRVGQWGGGRSFRGDGEEGRAGGDGVGFGAGIEANQIMVWVCKLTGGGKTGVDVRLKRTSVLEDALDIFKEILFPTVLGRE